MNRALRIVAIILLALGMLLAVGGFRVLRGAGTKDGFYVKSGPVKTPSYGFLAGGLRIAELSQLPSGSEDSVGTIRVRARCPPRPEARRSSSA